jgi:NADPH:quinone reductase-like Zn-dependent oxidoreductase
VAVFVAEKTGQVPDGHDDGAAGPHQGRSGTTRVFLSAEAGPFEDAISGVDVVIDTVGGVMAERSYAVMRPGGRLVTLGAPPAEDQARAHGVHAMFFVVTPDPGELAHLAGLVDQGRLRPVVSQVFALSEGRRAFESGRHPRPPGKTVLTVR